MAQSAFVNPPVGSALRLYVDEFTGGDPAALWRHEDEGIRLLGFLCELDREHRFWKLPFEVARDFVIRSALEAKHGKEHVDFLYIHLPEVVDRLTRLERDFAHRNASQRDRAPRSPSVKKTAIGITAAVFSQVFSKMPAASLNAKYSATAKRLGPGIDRHHVMRAVRAVCKIAKRQGNEGLLPALAHFSGRIEEIETEKLRKKA